MKTLSKIMKNTKLKFSLLLIVLFSLYTFVCAISYVAAVSMDIANSIFRLHVIANSDTKEDQTLKYQVRDNLIEYMNTISKDAKSKEEVMVIAKEHEKDFLRIAENTIEQKGFSYPVKVSIGNFEFPTKSYGDMSLPAGNYDALRIEIGEAKGQNWWCVMFPPLCFVDVSSGIVPEDSKELIKDSVSDEEYKIISEGNSNSSDNTQIQFKFKLIEWFQNNKVMTAQN